MSKKARPTKAKEPRLEPDMIPTVIDRIDRGEASLTVPDGPHNDIVTTAAGNFVDTLEKLPDLNHNQRRIAYYISLGHNHKFIAIQMGCTSEYVRVLSSQKRIKDMVDIFKKGQVMDILQDLSPSEVLERAASRAAEVLAEKLVFSHDENIQTRAATEILKMTGYGRDEEKIKIVIGGDVLDGYLKARQEAGIVVDTDFEILDNGEK